MNANFSFSSWFSIFRFVDYDGDDLPASWPLCTFAASRGSTCVATVQFVPFAPALSLIRKFLRMHLGKVKKYPLMRSGKVAR